MLDSDDSTRHRELLSVHRRTLHHYLRQQATLGKAHTPPEISSGISEARTEIRRIKELLRAHGLDVTNEPQDDDIEPLTVSEQTAYHIRIEKRIVPIMIGVIALGIVIWFGTQLVMNGMTAQSVNNNTIVPSAVASPSTGSTEGIVELPGGETLTIPYKNAKVFYTITQASLEPLNPSQGLLSLKIDASTTYAQGINFSTKQFGLRIGDTVLEPISFFDEPIYPNETKEIPVEFPVSIEPMQAYIRFTIGESPVELPISVK